MKSIISISFLLLFIFGKVQSEESKQPPVPKWKPKFSITIEQVLERMKYYTDGKKDIIVFKNGTAVIIPDGKNNDQAKKFAMKTLYDIFHYHPDMNPQNMDDGNILVRYNHPAYNVVINKFVKKHIKSIKKNHLDALATHEVLITPLGSNKFDEFGMKALYGRCFMFMDALKPEIKIIHRATKNNKRLDQTGEAKNAK